MGDPPPPGTTAEIRCSLPDGRYLMTGVFEEASSRGLVFLIGPKIFRAQMRRDFRVDVPRDTGIRYELDRVGQRYLPEGMAAPGFYQPVERGLEIRIADKLRELQRLNDQKN